MGVMHIQGVEAAFDWEWVTFIFRGSSGGVRGDSRVGVVRIQGMEAVFVRAWCTFWVWDGGMGGR